LNRDSKEPASLGLWIAPHGMFAFHERFHIVFIIGRVKQKSIANKTNVIYKQ